MGGSLPLVSLWTQSLYTGMWFIRDTFSQGPPPKWLRIPYVLQSDDRLIAEGAGGELVCDGELGSGEASQAAGTSEDAQRRLGRDWFMTPRIKV